MRRGEFEAPHCGGRRTCRACTAAAAARWYRDVGWGALEVEPWKGRRLSFPFRFPFFIRDIAPA
jgi:hypothetical protein